MSRKFHLTQVLKVWILRAVEVFRYNDDDDDDDNNNNNNNNKCMGNTYGT
jgi:hypothetical protein